MSTSTYFSLYQHLNNSMKGRYELWIGLSEFV